MNTESLSKRQSVQSSKQKTNANNGYNSLLRKCISGRFFPTFNLEQNQKADFIAAPFRRDLPGARRSQSRNEIIARTVGKHLRKP